MNRKVTIAWFVWGALIIGCMMWHDFHLPNCLALYGDGTLDNSYKFLACESENRASVFLAQGIGIAVILVSAALMGIAVAIFEPQSTQTETEGDE